ncbi:Adenylosuccinate synthetase [Symbiodinium microadriaticum]|uniref:Adenylosuccinate synthetase n=1 Tax=Symbiodinium microadriaticum TaxID=2951 RepID=A0A1Q9DDD5_SYMMI|nr:Adenylosuccinate synthetase [Symbiodinium microadriaticum]
MLAHFITASCLCKGKYILTGNLTTAIFANDCRFVDPNNAVTGLAQYRQALALLFDPSESFLNLEDVSVVDGGIQAKYVAGGTLKLPWRPRIEPWSGSIQYTLTSDGLIGSQATFRRRSFMATKLKGIKVLDRSISGEDSRFCVVLGAQWGDEGKGKLVDILAQDVQLCARFNGGANAGHTLLVDGKKYAFHLLPCGMINQACKNLIGNGVVVHVPTLMRELQELKEFDPRALERVFISTRAHILFDSHQIIDGILEAEQGTNSIGTTKRGIGPCYSAKAIRNGLRFGDLLHFEEFERRLRELIAWSQKRFGDPRERDTPAQLQLRKALREYNTKYAFDPEEGKKGGVSNVEEEIARYRQFAELLRPQIVDSVTLIHEDISRGYKVLVEGANAALLDIDFGTYPFVTSSNTTVGSVCTGLGVPPKQIDTVIGVVKAYTTRVGHGPFPTELQNEAQTLDDHLETYIGPAQSMARKGHSSGPYELKPDQQVRVGEMLQEVGHEYGTTTGRRRRCGWLDLALVKYSAMVNGFDSINLTKLDVLTGLRQIRIAIAYRNKQMTEVRLPPGYFPSHLEDLKEVVCEYETMQGWSEDISKVTDFADLPTNAKKYVLRIQELLGIPVSWVGVGPDRSSMLKVDIPIVRPDGSISASPNFPSSPMRGSPRI